MQKREPGKNLKKEKAMGRESEPVAVGGSMYDPVFRMSVLDDGTFYIELTITKERTEAEKKKGLDWPRTLTKTVTATDVEGIKSIIDEYVPTLAKQAEKQDDDFESAFKSASKET